MSTTSINDGFFHLCALGLITGEQLENIAAHATPILLKPDAGPAEQLAWTVEHHIVSHGALLTMADGPPANANRDQLREREAILDRTMALLETRAEAINEKLLEQLREMGLISAIQRDSTLRQRLPYILGSPSRALAYAVECGAVSRACFAELALRVQSECDAQEDKTGALVVEEASVIVQALDMVREAESASAPRSGLSIALEVLLWLSVVAQVASFVL